MADAVRGPYATPRHRNGIYFQFRSKDIPLPAEADRDRFLERKASVNLSPLQQKHYDNILTMLTPGLGPFVGKDLIQNRSLYSTVIYI